MTAVITLLTDFGDSDSYVAQMKGVILCIAPACQIIDATHEISPQNILAGARALRDYALLYPDATVHVAVVDPGVGTARRIIAAEIRGKKFVLPDNGLLSGVLEDFEVEQAVVVENQRYFRKAISSTFHGRDIMAPVAAHLALGLELSELGEPAGELVRLKFESAKIDVCSALAEVMAVDRFGNVITNIPANWLIGQAGQTSKSLFVRTGETEDWIRVTVVSTYGQSSAGSLVALIGSKQTVELAVVGGFAAGRLQVGVRDRLILEFK